MSDVVDRALRLTRASGGGVGWRQRHAPAGLEQLAGRMGVSVDDLISNPRLIAAYIGTAEGGSGPRARAIAEGFLDRVDIYGGGREGVMKSIPHYDTMTMKTPTAIGAPGDPNSVIQRYDPARGQHIVEHLGAVAEGKGERIVPAGYVGNYSPSAAAVQPINPNKWGNVQTPDGRTIYSPTWAHDAVKRGEYRDFNGEILVPQDPTHAGKVRWANAGPAPNSPISDYEGAIAPPTPTPSTSGPMLAGPSPDMTPSKPVSVADSGFGSFLPKASEIEAAGKLASLFAPQKQEFYDVPKLQPVQLGTGNPQALLQMAEAAGMGGGYIGGGGATDRAVRLARADGGGIPAEDTGDTGMNLPEGEQSLLAQQQQLLEGRRPAQMFPIGTPELPVPPGIGRVVTSRGVFHYNPDKITAEQIIQASAEGRENEILGLGPMSKADVVDAAAVSGERPVAISERNPAGAEVKASLSTPSTVAMQSRDILANKAPENTVAVEPVEAMLQDRIRERTGLADLDRDSKIETALRVGNPDGFARGGKTGGFAVPYANPIPYADGPIMGATGGRADKIPTTVRGGSHVIPSDVVSSLGQGNTTAGMSVLSRMFKSGPYGMPMKTPRRADGGEVPVLVSDGEFVVSPEVVAELGGGNQDAGHEILDQFILGARKSAIETLKRLPGPAKD